jgi:Spy/CpxP family protein refolding chaperone
MKKALIITSLVALLGASVAMADHGFGGGFGGGKGLERMKTLLGLSDTQSAQVEVIMQEQKTKMEALRTETEQRIQSLLTPEQASKFADMQQKRQEHMQQRQERMQQKPQDGGFF